MTSEWIYEDKSLEPPIIYDKDFKRLNKMATAQRVTTCIDQYKMRQGLAKKVRIRGPGENAIKNTFKVATVDVREIENAFGRPNRPSTPMKAVMSHHYENEAADIQEMKNIQNEAVFHTMQKFNGVRSHTRASAMASDHVRGHRGSFVSGCSNAPDMWKMKQFQKVTSRVGGHHENSRARSATIRKWR